MRHTFVASAVAAFLCKNVISAPTIDDIFMIEETRRSELTVRAVVDPALPWISVDDESQPATTYTPSPTVVDGTTSWKNGAPHDLTAEVYTWTTWGVISTSTGDPPNPTATGKHGEGAFSKCSNLDGEQAPFCRPAVNTTLLIGNTYFITWDPEYFNHTTPMSNGTYDVAVRLDYFNRTSKVYEKLGDTFKSVPASFGFWPLKVDSKLLKYGKDTNVTITLLSSRPGNNAVDKSIALPVFISQPDFEHVKDPKLPHGETLVIALPVVFGSIAIIIFGVFLWNRKTRKIHIGNIMGRSSGRNGYNGVGKRRIGFRSRKDNGIQLNTHVIPPPIPRGQKPPHDRPEPDYPDYSDDVPERPRRDSDALGSLANSPVHTSFYEQGTTGGRNTFRDEVQRQDQERRGDGPRFL